MRGLCSSGRLSLGLRGAPPRGEPAKTISATFALLDMSGSISFDNFIMTYRHLLHTLLNLYIFQDSAINPPYRCGVLYWRDDCSSHTNWITKYLPQRSSLGNAIVLFKVFKIFWPSQRNVIDADKSTTWSLIGSRKHPNIPNSWGQELHFQRADGENCSSAWAQTCSWLEKKLCCHFELFLPICATRCRQPEYFSIVFSSRIRIHEIFNFWTHLLSYLWQVWQVDVKSRQCTLHLAFPPSHFFAFSIFSLRWPLCSQFCCFPYSASWAPAMSAR